MEGGRVLSVYATTDIDSVVFLPSDSIPNITDADGNTYKSIIIGEQEWMTENLRTTKYSDGTSIPNIKDGDQWNLLNTGAWCQYFFNSQYEITYGKLYNWYAVKTEKLCPTGWHVPTDGEVLDLIGYLKANGNSGTEGTVLKSTSGWDDKYDGTTGNGTDDYGWLGLPGGFLSRFDGFDLVGDHGYWWSSSITLLDNALGWYLSSEDATIRRQGFVKKDGFSVRCIKD